MRGHALGDESNESEDEENPEGVRNEGFETPCKTNDPI